MNTIPSQHEASSGHKLPRGVWIGGALIIGACIVAMRVAGARAATPAVDVGVVEDRE